MGVVEPRVLAQDRVAGGAEVGEARAETQLGRLEDLVGVGWAVVAVTATAQKVASLDAVGTGVARKEAWLEAAVAAALVEVVTRARETMAEAARVRTMIRSQSVAAKSER